MIDGVPLQGAAPGRHGEGGVPRVQGCCGPGRAASNNAGNPAQAWRLLIGARRDVPPNFEPARRGGPRGRGVNGDPVVRHSFRHSRPEGCVHVRASARVHAGNGRILRSGRSSRGKIDHNIGQVVDVPNTTLSAVLPLDILDRRSASSRPGLEIFCHWPISAARCSRCSVLSAVGPTAKCRPGPEMSDVGGRPDVMV